MSQSDFEKITKESRENSFLKELWMMLRDKKKFWLMPIVVVLLLFAILVFLSGTAVAPFIYTLF
jgi:hypothetical protein